MISTNHCYPTSLKNFQKSIVSTRLIISKYTIFSPKHFPRSIFVVKLDNSARTSIDRGFETTHQPSRRRKCSKTIFRSLRGSHLDATRRASIGNPCWQTDDETPLHFQPRVQRVLPPPPPPLPPLLAPSNRSFISCFPPSVRKVHSDGSGQRAISMPVDQSPHPTAKLWKR